MLDMLPHGFLSNGAWHDTAQLRPLSGREEEFLLEHAPLTAPAAITTQLLARCLVRLGPWRPATPDGVRELCVGDREALLLKLRQITFGDAIACVLTCPNVTCGTSLEFSLSARNLLVAQYRERRDIHERTIEHEGAKYSARFRLPSGADQEAAAERANSDTAEAARFVLGRCIVELSPAAFDTGALPPPMEDAISNAMAEIDTQAEIGLNLMCPACERPFQTVFDTGAFLRREILGRGSPLYREVHRIACRYHWGESDILGLSIPRRRRYLSMISESSQEGVRA